MTNTIFISMTADDLLGMINECIQNALTLKTQVKTPDPIPEDLITIEDMSIPAYSVQLIPE